MLLCGWCRRQDCERVGGTFPCDAAPTSVVDPEPPPTVSDRPTLWPQVIEEVTRRPPFGWNGPVTDALVAAMRERDSFGRTKYGTPLQAHNGRRPLVDAVQEVLDLVVYLHQAEVETREEGRDKDAGVLYCHKREALDLAFNLFAILLTPEAP